MSDDLKTDSRPEPKKRGLGRGLNALFEDEEGVYPQADAEGHTPGAQRLMAGIDQLEPGSYQPRRQFTQESIDELAESIALHGVLQPLIVRSKRGFSGTYEIIAGERRWRAAQKAQLHEVPVILKEMSDKTALEIALIENLQREDLNPVEEAHGYKQLMEEFGHTQEKAAAVLGKSRSHVANMVRLLILPRSIIDMMREGKLSAGHARTLITAKDPEALANFIVNEKISVREAERMAAQKSGRQAGSKKKSRPQKDVDTLALEEEITNALGMDVRIDVKGEGKGTLKVSFKTLDQLDEVLHRLSHFPGRQQAG